MRSRRKPAVMVTVGSHGDGWEPFRRAPSSEMKMERMRLVRL
jgi:hypothetical protein